MAEMTMVGNWTGPHPSSMHEPPTSTGVRPAGAYRGTTSAADARRSSSPPPPATGRRHVASVQAPVVDIQICMALSGRPASMEGLSLEPADVGGTSELGCAPPASAHSHSSWSGNESVVPLARPRAIRADQAAAAPEAAQPAAQSVAAQPVAARPVAAQPVAAQPSVPAITPPLAASVPAARAPRRRKKGWLLAALAALGVLLALALQLRVRAPIEGAGVVSSPQAVSTVVAAQPGTLLQLLVQPGEEVVENQIVAQLATGPFEAELALRWEAFLELQVELAAADGGLLRDESAAALAQAAWGLVEAQSALAAASVRAPCRGRVEALVARPGSVLVPGQALLQLAPTGVAHSIIAFLPAAERPFMQPGAAAAVLLPAPEQTVPRSSAARVTHIAPHVAAPEELRATLAGDRAGAFVRVQLELQGAEPELLAQLRTGERVLLRLPGREQPLLYVLLDSLRALLAPAARAVAS